jgi:uncharacterized protein YndB with AHSA1/START domain
MTTTDFSLTLTSSQTPEQVFEAITNVPAWWSGYYSEEIKGGTKKLNDEFSFFAAAGPHYSKQKLVELIPNKKIVWLITESDLGFLEHKSEWTGTKVIFEISEKDGKTQLVFTHEGLTPQSECYDACAPGWTQYLQNKLSPLINAGKAAMATK